MGNIINDHDFSHGVAIDPFPFASITQWKAPSSFGYRWQKYAVARLIV